MPVVNHALTVVNHSLTVENGETIGEGETMTGEMVGLDVATGKEVWNEEYETAAFGAPVAVNDMVFFATFDGTLHGPDGETGGEVWSASLASSHFAVTITARCELARRA